ncbi:lipase family protein [Marinomonas sp.]|nr:lipase family protein [Marinomonas sp.]
MYKVFLSLTFSLLLNPFQFLLAEQDFTFIEAQAKLSNDAYLELRELEAALSGQGQSLLHKATIQQSQVNYFLAESVETTQLASQGELIQAIGIRGTANLNNVMLDLSVSLQEDVLLGIKLHKGFAEGAKAVYDDLRPYLSKDNPITITGHSLGGAIAVILAMYLQQEGYDVPQVVTFGQPKVTNVTGANTFNSLPVIRVVTPDDIVPLVPPISPLQIKDLDIYWHIGVEVILREEGEYAETQGVKSALRATKFTNAIPSEKNLQAHKMAGYLQQVSGLKESSKEIPYKTEISLFGLSFD